MPQNRIARLNSDGTFDSSFNVGTGANNTVNSVALQSNGKVLVGGAFTDYNGNLRNRLIRLNTNGSLDTDFVSGFDNILGFVQNLLLQSDGKLLVGGTFTNYIGVPRTSFLRLGATRTPFDFDGDGRTDVSVFRPTNGNWYLNRSQAGYLQTQFGLGSDTIAPADYDGDGKTDIAVWRSSNGNFYIINSSDGSIRVENFGLAGDIVTVADWDGDGKADLSVYRGGAQGVFYYRGSLNNPSGNITFLPFGTSGDKPVVGDYDGDGKVDAAIFRPNGGIGAEWWIRRSSNGSTIAIQFGISTDKPVQGDYTGDGKTDIAVFRPSSGTWFVLRSEDFSFFAFPFGISTDILAPGDYDGDGKIDAGVFRPSSGTWYIQGSTAGILIQTFGITGDLPTPNAFVP